MSFIFRFGATEQIANCKFAIGNLQWTWWFLFIAGFPCLASPAAAQDKVKPAVTALAITPDGKSFLQGSQSGVSIHSIQEADERRGSAPPGLATTLDHVQSLVFSSDGTRLAVAGGSPAQAGIVELWSWPEKKLLGKLEGHQDLVSDAAWLPDSKTLATAGADRTIRIWDAGSCKCLKTVHGHSGPVLALAVSPDGKWLCSGSFDQTIRVWNTADWQLARSLDNHLGAVHALSFRPPREGHACLVSVSADGTARIWQPAIGRMMRIIRQPGPVSCVAWSSDGDCLIVGGKDGRLRTIDAEADEVKERRIPAGRITSLLVGKNGLILAGTSQGDVVQIKK
jgi:WD40 repeat protein